MKDIPQSLYDAVDAIDTLDLTDNLKARTFLARKIGEWEQALEALAQAARDHSDKAGE